MNYATIKKHDIANGTGVRVSLFVSGCTHHCKGCFNPETWDFSYGEPFTEKTENEIITALSHDYISGLSLLGGEPFEPSNQAVLAPFLTRVKALFPAKDIWCYSGYNFEADMLTGKLGDSSVTDEMLKNIDILVDGEFVESLKDISLRFKGSSNQRIIDVQKSLETDTLVLWGEESNIDRKDISGGTVECKSCGE
ncbi:MAG: anaerobic ribonucleoside-triphosphate reductase activating protein [Clostridia bacterium]|nr:anaerobic ribonucleoside-triphosphate reductase activating protein [Clostridia bacterium]